MKQSIKSYVPQIAVEKRRRQSFFGWIVFAFLTVFWVSLIILAPVAEANDITGVSNPIYKFFGFICHQISSRSFFIENQPFAVCSRCFGIYFGLLAGSVCYPFLRPLEKAEPLSYFWLFLAMIPMAFDWSLGFFGIWNNTLISRFLTGLILGTVCAMFIIPALVEIISLYSIKKQ